MSKPEDSRRLLRFIEQKGEKKDTIRICYGSAATTITLERSPQFTGQLIIGCSVQIEELSRQAVEWIESYAKLMAKDCADYSLEQSEHHPYIYYINRRGSFIEERYETPGDLLVEIVTFAVELLAYVFGLRRESYAWQEHFGGVASPTPEDVYQWLEGGAGLQALR